MAFARRKVVGTILALALLAAETWSQAGTAALSSDARALGGQAEARRFAEDWYGAVELYIAALQKNPSYGDALLGLAECYYQLEEYDQALSYASRAAPFKRGDHTLANLEGFIKIGLGDLAGARERFESVAGPRPNDLDARFGLALLDLAAGKKTEAKSRLEESLRLSPQNARALLSLALIAQDQGRAQEARILVEKALRAHGSEPRVQLGAARIAAGRGDWETAIFHGRKALDQSPDYSEARSFLAALLYDRADYEGAADLMREAVARNRKDPAAWFSLGLAQSALGRGAEAVYSLRTASGLAPDDEIIRIALENIIADVHPLESAIREPYAEWHFSRGQELEGRSLFDQALFEYRRGLRIFPYSKRGRTLYAELLRKRGLPAKHLSELRFLESIGKADRAALDSIEIYESLLADGVGRAWGVDQYGLPKRPYRIAIFSLPGAGESYHAAGKDILIRYLADLLSSSSRVSVLPPPVSVQSQSDAFKKAREGEADYFLLFSLRETERELELSAELRVARTGSLASSFRAYRTGNDRVKNTSVRLSSLILDSLPPKGSILKRSHDKALVDLGSVDGLKAGDELLILKKGSLDVLHEGLGHAYQESSIVGRLKLTRLDEECGEGVLASSGFFDTINPGDEVIAAPPKAQSGEGQALEKKPVNGEASWPGLFLSVRRLR